MRGVTASPFTLEATEGRMFKPLALTKTYSMGFAAILAVTLTPALAALFIRGKILKEEKNPLNRWLVKLYTPVVHLVVQYRRTVIVLAVVAMAFTVPAFMRLGNEFMPPLNEGSLMYMPNTLPSISLTQQRRLLQVEDSILMTFPEVESVWGKAGRANTATDWAP